MIHPYLKFAVLGCFIISGCTATKYQNQGQVEPVQFHYKTTFVPYKSCVVFPAIIGSDTCNFLFDTGCQITLVQNDSVKDGNVKITGASDRSMKLGHVVIDSLRIGNVSFKNTQAATGDFDGLKAKIPDFGGLIGQPIISKANWLIDYTTNTIEIFSEDLIDPDFRVLPTKVKSGWSFIWITIDGHKYKALMDLGSSKGLSIPQDTKTAETIIRKYKFTENTREIYRIGGLEQVRERVGRLPIGAGDLLIKDVETSVLNTNKIRIGNFFFKDCALYIDNTHKCYKVKKIR